jgi:hypothetical protein
VDLAGSIDAKSNQKFMLPKEGAPLVIEENAICLEGLLDNLTGSAVLFDEFDRAPEEVKLHQSWFPALPRDRYMRRPVRFQQLADVFLQRDFGHPLPVVRI